ncbi:MAG TPA: adenylate kinase [Candidatus Polarisedimenticolaceae bacterium]|nr:adenylate kinase [Candidatus Polarisedimenticolaceae bacterium]
MRVVLMGPPGVGKGTQAARLKTLLGVPHVSTGDILRASMQERSALGNKVRGFVESGRLVPDALMGELIGERLQREDAAPGFILDGFPRTLEQVATLERVTGRLGRPLDKVLMLVAPESEIVRRLSGRRTCPSCGSVYHLDSKPPKAAGICDACGATLVQRPDDTEAVIRERLRIYEEQTVPVANAYRERGILAVVDGTGDLDAVAERLTAGLGPVRERS